jgi:hypothetical protein
VSDQEEIVLLPKNIGITEVQVHHTIGYGAGSSWNIASFLEKIDVP